MSYRLCLLALLVIAVAPTSHGDTSTQPVYFQAHRGGLHEVPENTMAAYYYAWELGGIPEIDIRTTRDGVIVCLHDATLKRTTNASAEADTPVDQLTLGNVQQHDAGAWFDNRYRGERVPTLAQVFTVLQRHSDYQIYLDLKAVDLPALAALIAHYDVAAQIIFCHNRIESCQTMKEAIPALRTMLWIGGDPDTIWETFQAASRASFAGLDQVQLHLKPSEGSKWPYALLEAQLVEALHRTRTANVDLEVLPFQFTREGIQSLREIGIQWYATDEPRRFRQCLGLPVNSSPFPKNGVTAHRGDSGSYPENTMAAINAALALAVDWIEIDIFKTKDGELVVTHDETTERITDVALAIAESSLAELQQLDVAMDFRKQKALDFEHCPPATMPTLRQVLLRMQQQQTTRLSIQPKAPIVDDAIALIRELDAEAWVGFNDGDLEKMSRVKALAPEIPVFWDRFQNSPLAEDMLVARDRGFEAIVPHVAALTPETIAMLKQGGFEVGAWTINDSRTMQHLLNGGVDRIYTDYPDRLLALK